MATFPTSLVTPERILTEEEVEAVVMRTDGGDATFMPGHSPLIGALVPGTVRFQHEDGTEARAAVHGGFVRVEGDHVTILAPVAELSQDIDVERARRALEGASERVTKLGGARAGPADGGEEEQVDRDLVAAEAALRRAQVRLEAAGATDSLGS